MEECRGLRPCNRSKSWESSLDEDEDNDDDDEDSICCKHCCCKTPIATSAPTRANFYRGDYVCLCLLLWRFFRALLFGGCDRNHLRRMLMLREFHSDCGSNGRRTAATAVRASNGVSGRDSPVEGGTRRRRGNACAAKRRRIAHWRSSRHGQEWAKLKKKYLRTPCIVLTHTHTHTHMLNNAPFFWLFHSSSSC